MNRETEIVLAKMKKGICGVCNRPIKKHTKNARKVCYALCQKRYGIGRKTIKMPDGREVEIGITPASLVDDKK